MTSKKRQKILIKPIGNAQAIASTLGITEIPSKAKETATKETAQQTTEAIGNKTPNQQARSSDQTESKITERSLSRNKQQREESRSDTKPYFLDEGREGINNLRSSSNYSTNTTSDTKTLPLMIEIKHRLPGKELFILSLLYLQKNQRGMVQMTVNSLMTLYSSIFEDTIKDDTVRRSLKRLADASLIKTKSIPGNNAGYVYEIEDLLQAETFTSAEKEEFIELVSFVEIRIMAQAR